MSEKNYAEPMILTRETGASIAYHALAGKSPGIVFMTGFMSDMTGSKARALEDLCRDRGHAFLRFDYQGHGASSGNLADGTIGLWAEDALAAFDALTGGPQVIVGSSMGGLISAYAIAEYPEMFGGAACLSTHWPVGFGTVVQWFDDHWPVAGSNRLYFDYGTETLDAQYEPYQQQMDTVMRKYGYTEGEDWVTRRFAGEEHSPRAWRERLHIPLAFLLGIQ